MRILSIFACPDAGLHGKDLTTFLLFMHHECVFFFFFWVFIRLIFAFFAGITHVIVPKRGVGRATPLGNGCILFSFSSRGGEHDTFTF